METLTRSRAAAVPQAARLLLIPILCAPACSPPPLEDPPAVTLERPPGGNAEFITIESDTVVEGRRPKLVLVCQAGTPATFRLDLVRAPSATPPQRVFTQMQVKGGPEVTIEIGWLEGAVWTPKMPDPKQPEFEAPDRNNRERVLPILHAFSRERALTITPPAAYGPGQKLVWSPQTYAPHAPLLRRCTELERAEAAAS